MSPTCDYSPQHTSEDQRDVETSSTRKGVVLVLRALVQPTSKQAPLLLSVWPRTSPPTCMECTAPQARQHLMRGKRVILISQAKHVIPIQKVSFIRIMLSCSLFGEKDQPFLRSLERLPERGSAKQQPSYVKGKSWNHQEVCNFVS